MKLDAKGATALQAEGKTVEVRFDGMLVPPETLVMADEEVGVVERFVGDTPETTRAHGEVKIRIIESLGVLVSEQIRASEG